jgi:hypothetical protein
MSERFITTAEDAEKKKAMLSKYDDPEEDDAMVLDGDGNALDLKAQKQVI